MNPDDVASVLQAGVGRLIRRFRQLKATDALAESESLALAHLDRGGPATSSEMARREQISPQSMGATFATLEARGLVDRTADPDDGRRIVLSVSASGAEVLRTRRSARTDRLVAALTDGFTTDELRVLGEAGPLLERLAERL